MHWSPALDAFLLTRYQDVLAAFKDPRLSSRRAELHVARMPASIRAEMAPLGRSLGLWSFFQDPPDHTRIRALQVRAFAPRLVEGFRPRVAAIVDRLLAPALARGSMDVVRDLANPLPVTIIGEMLGIAAEDHDDLKRWSTDLGFFLAARSREAEVGLRALAAWREMTAYMRGVVESRRKEPRDDLISALIAAEVSGSVHTEDELLATSVHLLFGGHETTTHIIGNGVAALLDEPARLEELRGDPTLLPSAVEELLRFVGPVQILSRIAKEPIEVAGRAIPAGARVMLIMGAANRDPDQFADPERLDLRRDPNRHLAFGFGPHFCVGAELARLEAGIAIGALLARTTDLRRAGEGPLAWNPNVGLRGLARLPVAFTAS